MSRSGTRREIEPRNTEELLQRVSRCVIEAGGEAYRSTSRFYSTRDVMEYSRATERSTGQEKEPKYIVERCQWSSSNVQEADGARY